MRHFMILSFGVSWNAGSRVPFRGPEAPGCLCSFGAAVGLVGVCFAATRFATLTSDLSSFRLPLFSAYFLATHPKLFKNLAQRLCTYNTCLGTF